MKAHEHAHHKPENVEQVKIASVSRERYVRSCHHIKLCEKALLRNVIPKS